MEGREQFFGPNLDESKTIDTGAETEAEQKRVDPHAKTIIEGSNPLFVESSTRKYAIMETTLDPKRFIKDLSALLTVVKKKQEGREAPVLLDEKDSERAFSPQRILEVLRTFNASELPPSGYKEFIRKEVWSFLNRKQAEEVLAAFQEKDLLSDEKGAQRRKLSKEIEKISARYNKVIDEMNEYLGLGEREKIFKRD
jgi:RecA-family ATPase